jgi:dihydroorotase
LLFLDVNLGNGSAARIIVFEEDDAVEVAQQFCKKNGNKIYIYNSIVGLDDKKYKKLLKVIEGQMQSVVPIIPNELETEYMKEEEKD